MLGVELVEPWFRTKTPRPFVAPALPGFSCPGVTLTVSGLRGGEGFQSGEPVGMVEALLGNRFFAVGAGTGAGIGDGREGTGWSLLGGVR